MKNFLFLALFILCAALALPGLTAAQGTGHFLTLPAASPEAAPTAPEKTESPKTAPALSLIPTASPTMGAPVTAPTALPEGSISQQIETLVTTGEFDVEPQETFGTRTLGLVLTLVNVLREQGSVFLTNFAALPQIGTWIQQQASSPATQERWMNIGELLVLALGGAFAVGGLFHFILRPLRRHVTHRMVLTYGGRVAAAVAWIGLSLVPVFFAIGTALVLMNQSDPAKLTRYVVMSVIYALALQRLVQILVAALFAPKTPSARLINLSDESIRYIRHWVRWLSFVIIYGYFFIDVARVVRIPASAIAAVSNLLGLVIVIMTITIIHKKRLSIAGFLRGNVRSSYDLTLWQSLRLWIARTWNKLAITYLVGGYLVAMLGGGISFRVLLVGTIFTLLVLTVTRLFFHGIDRVGLQATSRFYGVVMRGFLRLAVAFVALIGILSAWGVDFVALLDTPWGQRITGSALSIFMTVFVAAMAYEALNAWIEKQLNQHDTSGVFPTTSARAKTLLPLARNAALIFLSTIVILMILSELGVNIAPLLAGAGILGVAIGFGSQSLVKDFITGLFILIEDTIAIGDSITVDSFSGIVESMTLRTLRLRAFNGDLHVLPYSEVLRFTNQSKGFAYAVIDIGVAYGSDMKKVSAALEAIAADLASDEIYRALLLGSLEMFGIERLADSSIIVRCRIKTKPGRQSEIRRAFLKGIKEKFEAEKIEIPFPTVKHVAASDDA